MDAFYRVVLVPTAVDVGVVGKGRVAGLTRQEEIGSVMDAGSVGVQVACRSAAACGVRGILEAFTGGEVWGTYGGMEDIAE